MSNNLIYGVFTVETHLLYYSSISVEEQINRKIQQLPISPQSEVLDFVEFLIQKSNRRETTELTPEQKAAAFEKWANSHPIETPLILDDCREIIYED